MSECKHERIRVFYNAETGEAVSLWACTECDYRFVPIAEAESLRAENERLARARAIVDEQAEDDGLWFAPITASEAYLQKELRRLHAAVEGER